MQETDTTLVAANAQPRPQKRRSLLRRLVPVYYILFALILLALIPPYISVNRYQRRIAASISQSLGRPVHLDDVSLTLLPFPGFTITNLVVPPGKVFAMGDNRTESLDGRFWGFVPRENIVGRPMFVYWSFETPADQINKQSIGERISFMAHILIHIFDETRWKRTFHLIK